MSHFIFLDGLVLKNFILLPFILVRFILEEFSSVLFNFDLLVTLRYLSYCNLSKHFKSVQNFMDLLNNHLNSPMIQHKN